MNKNFKIIIWFSFCIIIHACTIGFESAQNHAPGAPGETPYWNHGGKIGIGTSYEEYGGLEFSDTTRTGEVSKVWFTIGRDGVISETAWGMVHEMQLKNIIAAVKVGDSVEFEGADTHHTIDYLLKDAAGRPLSTAYKIISTDYDSLYRIEKHVFTDPSSQSLMVRIRFEPLVGNITPYLIVNPYMDNTGINDKAFIDEDGLHAAEKNNKFLTIKSSEPFQRYSVGYKGVSDGATDLRTDGNLDWLYTSTGDKGGNVILTGGWAETSGHFTTDIVIGFGNKLKHANSAAQKTLDRGYDVVLDEYNGAGAEIGWQDYLLTLEHLPEMYPNTGDEGKLLNVSALVLKTLEDKENAGALVASLSFPWGDSAIADKSATGYRAVWPRDFYQCAMALLALGDTETPMAAFNFLENVQVTKKTKGNKGENGWFLQKTVVDGTVEWYQIQLDQTAMPIMLGWKLWKQGLLIDRDLKKAYIDMIRPAGYFLTQTPKEINFRDNQAILEPPFTQQERWEEQQGYSPSTTAAVITGLAAAADMASHMRNDQAAVDFLIAADKYFIELDSTTFTTEGSLGEGDYFIRISRNRDPNDQGLLGENNGRPGMPEDKILDAGFLELVRYGLRNAADSAFVKTIKILDDTTLNDVLQVKYYFEDENGNTYEGWRRYGNDGYGEDIIDGSNYGRFGPGQRGRVWPLFTGERGHYELERKLLFGSLSDFDREMLIKKYVMAMEYFANEGLMLPEQVWDGIGENGYYSYEKGQGTSSATPLAWAHAEYVKLVKSITDGKIWDRYSIVEKRYKR